MKHGISKGSIGRIAAVALASIAVAGVGTQASAAGGGAVKSDVTIKYKKSFQFSGNVSSQSRKCERNRQVRIFRKVDGNDPVVTGDKTDSAGKYKAEVQGVLNGGDKHYAVALEKTVDGVTCKQERSGTVVPNEELP